MKTSIIRNRLIQKSNYSIKTSPWTAHSRAYPDWPDPGNVQYGPIE